MSDRNDFDFEDDFLSDDNEPFDFDEEEGFPSGLGDELESDMPEIEEEQEERGGNRTFVVLAGIMIILFVGALAVVLFLATRPVGTSDFDITRTYVAMYNSTIESYAAQTATQNALNLAMTQTAAAWTATPSPTLTPSETLTPEPSVTLEPSTVPTDVPTRLPTITVTPSQDLTQQAILQLANGALTLTAMAANATATPTPEPPTDVPAAALDLRGAWATQVAFATAQGEFDQERFGTLVAIATLVATNSSLDADQQSTLQGAIEATRSAVINQVESVQTAIAYVDFALATAAVGNEGLATQLAIVIPSGLQTQAALGTPFAQATISAIGTQAALGTLSADINRQSTPSAMDIHEPSNAKRVPLGQEAETATAAVLATRASFSTQAAQSTRSALATVAAGATQMSFATPPVLATQGAIATQVALATRQALIDMALGLISTPTPSGGGLESVNMTATAIAGAFLTATAQAVTPETIIGSPVPQGVATIAAPNLPQTGIFEDVVSGGSGGLGVMALAVVGLVGVIVVSRRLRSSNNDQPEQHDEPHDPSEHE